VARALWPAAAVTLAPALAAAAPAGEGNWLWRLYEAGGFFMHPILVCAVAAAAVALERAWAWWRDRQDPGAVLSRVLAALPRGTGAARAQAEHEEGPLGRILEHGLARAAAGREAVERGLAAALEIELYGLERGLLWLATVANVAPLLGFLGTVSGMIRAFRDIAAADRVSAQVVAAGIAEALLTTAFGLLVAIPVQVLYNLFLGRAERFGVVALEAEEDLLHALREAPRGSA
jgi:biopolymer transport protein ExbB